MPKPVELRLEAIEASKLYSILLDSIDEGKYDVMIHCIH